MIHSVWFFTYVTKITGSWEKNANELKIFIDKTNIPWLFLKVLSQLKSCFLTTFSQRWKNPGTTVGSQEKKIRKIYNLIWNNLKICHDVLAATKVFLRSLTTCNCVSTDLEFYLAIDCALAQNPPSAHDVLNIFASRSRRNKNARWLRAQGVLY